MVNILAVHCELLEPRTVQMNMQIFKVWEYKHATYCIAGNFYHFFAFSGSTVQQEFFAG